MMLFLDSLSPSPLLTQVSIITVSTIILGLVMLTILALRHHGELSSSCLYKGFVSHTRLKGATTGKTHSLNYPLFFSCIDLEEVHQVKWKLWPIFVANDFIHRSSFCFSSFDGKDHLKGHQSENTLYERAKQFLISKCSNIENQIGKIKLLTHLTYFGYCFNPLSIYYVYKKDSPEELLCVIAEVSNTPWIEQHSYALHESVPGVEITQSNDTFHAVWNKGIVL